MSCNYPKRYLNTLTRSDKGVVLGENVVLCVRGAASLPSTFYLLYNTQIPDAEPTYPIYISTRNSGNVPLVDSDLNVVTYGDLIYNTVYNLAKVNVCNNGDCCSNQQTTYYQLIGIEISGSTAANFF